MAKKHFGRLLTLAAVVGAAAAGISYFLQYKSFNKELEEDFHDFEDEFDDTEDTDDAETRSYVTLNTETRPAEDAPAEAAGPCEETAEEKEEAVQPASEAGQEEDAAPAPAMPPEPAAPETTVTVEEVTE